MKMIRQGDVLFIPRGDGEPMPEQCSDETKQKKGLIREGEATGHHHRIANLETADVFRFRDWREEQTFVRTFSQPSVVVHEEHGPVTLEADTLYEVKIAREFDYLNAMAPRYVRD